LVDDQFAAKDVDTWEKNQSETGHEKRKKVGRVLEGGVVLRSGRVGGQTAHALKKRKRSKRGRKWEKWENMIKKKLN